MTFHAKDSLRGSGVAKVFNFLLAVAAPEALSAKGLVACEDGEVFDLIPTGAATVRAVATDQRPITQHQEMCVRVEEGVTSAASETIDMPPLSSFKRSASLPAQNESL